MSREGSHHIDLWCDGRIYPKCFITNFIPFSNTTSLLKFVDDRNKGILGCIYAQFEVEICIRACMIKRQK